MKIQEWLDSNFINYSFENENIFSVPEVGRFLAVRDKDKILEEGLTLILDEDEQDVEVDFYCFKFGENFYYTKNVHLIGFNILKYIGKYQSEMGIQVPFLGVHGGYDILNGSRVYGDWVKKAKFLGVDCLGICEKNSLGGVVKFQLKCKDNGIKPVLGMQICVKNVDNKFFIKAYIKDERGWNNILRINRSVLVDNEGYIEQNELLNLTDGLIFVMDPKFIAYRDCLPYMLNLYKGDIYWQLDSVEFDNDDKDKQYLLNVSEFIKNSHEIPPVLICDAYYLDRSDSESKIILNNIADKREHLSRNQYFKTIEEIAGELYSLFKNEDKFYALLETAINNAVFISSRCEFNISIGQKLLPRYIMTEEEISVYGDKESMFYAIIEDGFLRKTPEGCEDEYLERLNKEISVIAGNDFIDYFLILWDIVQYSKRNDILVGIGRGSAGGSLLAYLMDITQLNPMEYDLLFERFLNEGRAKKSWPDIDTDFESTRREDIKKYMEARYGKDRVCSIGTYTNLKIKQALKDISRFRNIDFDTVNYISQVLDLEEGSWFDIFRTAVEKKRVKEFILDHPDVIEDIQLILNQPKSKSIHACAMIITPEGKSIYEWIPVRAESKEEEKILISEWEGSELEAVGFLKEDILGIKQLDKYRFILDLIKRDTGDIFDIYNLPLDDQNVYELFQNGYNGDVFHFGSKGLTKYCKELKPENINDLIAAIALYRPGAMENNFHNEYILRKDGEREVEYWVGAENILDKTYAVTVYQEQIMKLCEVLGGLSSVEADDVRRAMVKKKYDELHKYEERFLKYYPENFNVSYEYAKEVWDAIDKASTYLFNKSHAAAYAITGYIGQWLKVHYPLQYWSAALQFDDPNPKKSNMARYIGEIRKTSDRIKVKPPHINYSADTFTSNFEKQELYWSLGKVRQLGEKGLPAILDERSKNGEFFDFKDFISRIDRRLINKAVVLNLILSGCFDDIEGVINPEDRIGVIKKFAEIDHTIDINEYPRDRFWWSLKQREVSGFGNIDYARVLRQETEFKVSELVGALEVNDDSNDNKYVVVAGIINNFTVRISKKDNEYCDIELDCNNETVNVRIWSELYTQIKEELTVGKIFIMNGVIKFFREEGSVQSWEDSVIKIL